MSPDSQYSNRQSIRHKGYDYSSAGAYFVTVCTKDRLHVLEDDVLRAIVTDVWYALPEWFPTIGPDEFIIMPNHVHFVVWLGVSMCEDDKSHGQPWVNGRPQGSPLQGVAEYELPVCRKPRMNPTLGDVVGSWKSLSSVIYLQWVRENAPARRAKFWQRNYYDRIVRNERGLQVIRDYIRTNPTRWMDDPDNPDNLSGLPTPESIHDYLDDLRRFHRQTR